MFIYFMLIIFPMWCFGYYFNKISGATINPAVRPGKDHAHMAPRLLDHLKNNDFENKVDFLGRRTGLFYKNYMRQ